ncbi:GNAT family N-acetyltransferase [Flavobacterium sp.]|uniref:GNAT family N-acetyltransferase n=1 Tax=Flavobacterium sp. TaxID=239 RepID=UPI004048257D
MITFSSLQTNQIDIITVMMKDFYAIDNYPIDVATSEKLFQEFIADSKLGKAWLIQDEKEILGYLILTFVFSFEYKGKIAFLDELYIKASHRGKGIGKKAIQFIKEQATIYNFKIIYLEVENHNENAQKLYLSNGFETHNRKILKHAIEKL